MKILRNLVILCFAAFVIESCEKSNAAPHQCSGHHDATQAQPAPATPSGMVQSPENTTGNVSARSSVIGGEEELNTPPLDGAVISGDPNGQDVSGSGDDDRDGGERKRKR